MDKVNRFIRFIFRTKSISIFQASPIIEYLLRGHCFLTHLAKSKMRILLLPLNFNPEKHVQDYPPIQYGFNSTIKFKIDKMKYVLGLLSSIPAKNKDLITEHGFIPIHSTTIRKHIKDYLLYLNYLKKTGVIVCDDFYINGVKSYGYKWTEQYTKTQLVLVNQHEVVIGGFDDDDSDEFVSIATYPYLNYWYQQNKLVVNFEQAQQYAQNILEAKLPDKSLWDNNNDKNGKKHPRTQHDAVTYNLASLKVFDFRLKIDKKVHRLHSTLTNMQKEYRHFMTYNNEQLVSIDIKNCQPYLAGVIFKPEFWDRNSILPLNLYKLPHNIQTRLTEFSVPIMLGKFFRDTICSDFDEFIKLTASGKMYEAIQEIVYIKRQECLSRDDAKKIMLSLLFSPNKISPDNPKYDLIKVFKEKFPAVAKIFSIIKCHFKDGDDKQHNRLSLLLQSIESEIVLHRCCKRIWIEGGNKVPVITIHDSIVTTVGNVEFVKAIMYEELTKCIGTHPELKVEPWDPKIL